LFVNDLSMNRWAKVHPTAHAGYLWENEMRKYNIVLSIAVCLTFLSGICAKSQGRKVLTESVLTEALENGYSLVIADIIVFNKRSGGLSNVIVKVTNPIILGDLTEDDCNMTLNLSAGEKDLNSENIETGSRYALFIAKNCPYEYSWVYTNDFQRISKSDTNEVKQLMRLAESVYAKTSIISFRKELFSNDKVDLSSVPEEIISLCEKFKSDPENRSVTAQKIYLSDISIGAGTSRLPSEPDSIAPKILLSRNQIISLLGSPTIKSGWSYSWLCGQPVERGGIQRDVFVLSITFDENQKVQKMIYGQEKKDKWTKIRTAVNPLYDLPGRPDSVLLRFQRALQEQNWQAALSLCSENIQKKAKEGKSPEEFLKAYLPIDDLVKMTELPTRGYSGTLEKISNINLDISISSSKTDNEAPVSWKWSLVRDDENKWLVDFKVLPIDILVQKERLIRKFINAESNVRAANTAKFNQGIKFNLVPISEKYVIGQPMLFKVEMINTSDEPISFTTAGPTAIMTSNPMYITGPEKEEIDYIYPSVQIGVGSDVILPKETIVLVDSYDVTSQYFINKPGQYAFQFRGWPERGNKTSNTVELEVKQGELSAQDSIYERIIKVLPTGWQASRRLAIEKEADKQIFVNLIGERKSKQIDVGIGLLVSSNKNLLSTSAMNKFELWGKCQWGYVYVTDQNADTLWPDFHSQLIKALEIKEN
jgi:hypothetical protein